MPFPTRPDFEIITINIVNDFDSFNMVSSIVIVLAVGLSVDYSTHIVYAFLESPGTDRNARTKHALSHIGSTVLNGGITTWLAVSPLCTAKTYVFQLFFISFSVIAVFALFYGLILVPVLLSLVGPRSKLAPTITATGPPTPPAAAAAAAKQ